MKYKKIFELTKKVIILTGANGFLGNYFIKGIAEHGANLALIDIDQAKLKKLSIKLSQKYKVKCNYYVCDITNNLQVKSTVDKIKNDFGKIDVLVNNAQGNDVIKPFEDMTLEDWRKTSSVNEEGIFLVSQAVGSLMSKQKSGGSIIQISSIYGVVAPDHRIYENSVFNNKKMGSTAVYSFTKAGIIGLTKYLSTYWAEKGIRVNCITPGGIESNQNEVFKANYSSRIPLKRMGKPDEMVGGLIFLASNSSSYITGHNLIIDGGLSAW